MRALRLQTFLLTAAGAAALSTSAFAADEVIQTAHQEFRDWRWVTPEELPELIVPFKKKLYRDLVQEFQHLI